MGQLKENSNPRATVARGNGALLSITAQLDKLAVMIEKYQEISKYKVKKMWKW